MGRKRVEGGRGKGGRRDKVVVTCWAEWSDRVDISLTPDIQARAAASALIAPLSSMSWSAPSWCEGGLRREWYLGICVCVCVCLCCSGVWVCVVGWCVCVCMCCGGERIWRRYGRVVRRWKVWLTQHTDGSQGCLLLAIVQHGSYRSVERYLHKGVICVLSLPDCRLVLSYKSSISWTIL